MWISRGDRRFWISRHNQVGTVVYDPERDDDGPPGSVKLFVLETEAIDRFDRGAMRNRAVWSRLDRVEAERALHTYLDSIWTAWLNGSGLPEDGVVVVWPCKLLSGDWGVRIPNGVPGGIIAPGVEVQKVLRSGEQSTVTLDQCITCGRSGEVWSIVDGPARGPVVPRVVYELSSPRGRSRPVTARRRTRSRSRRAR